MVGRPVYGVDGKAEPFLKTNKANDVLKRGSDINVSAKQDGTYKDTTTLKLF